MPLNILHIIQRYPPAHGGSEAYFERLSKWLVGRGHKVTVWTTNAKDLTAFWNARAERVAAGNERINGVEVHRFPINHWPLRRYMLKALSLLPNTKLKAWTLPVNPICFSMRRAAGGNTQKFDIVHASAFPYLYPCLCGLKLAQRLNIPFVLTPFVHIGPWNDPDNYIRRAYLAEPMVWMLKQADLIFVQTPSEKKAILQEGVSEEKIVLQGLGVNADEVIGGDRNRARAEWGVGEDEIVVGHLANQSRAKGTLDLIGISDYFQGDRKSNFRLVLAGPRMPEMLTQPEKDFDTGNIIRQLGRLSDLEMRDFYAGIDLFCLPSITDSFGLVLLEAMANGKPCIGYRAGGIGDVLNGPGGMLVDCDPISLAEGIADMVRNPDQIKKMGEAGRIRCETEFQWEPKLELVEREIQKLIV